MRYGACSWVFGDPTLETTAAFLAEAGFDGVELKGDLSLYKPNEVKATLRAHGFRVLSLTPDNVDLAQPDVELRSEDEYRHFLAAVQQIARRAAELDLLVALEVLNRYESHPLNTAAQAIEFAGAVDQSNVGILLVAYHMNIEEANPATVILDAGDRLFLFHAADSNRQAVGRGHTDFLTLQALRRSGYNRDVIVECTAVGPDPFTPIKGNGWLDEVRQHTTESLRLLRAYASLT